MSTSPVQCSTNGLYIVLGLAAVGGTSGYGYARRRKKTRDDMVAYTLVGAALGALGGNALDYLLGECYVSLPNPPQQASNYQTVSYAGDGTDTRVIDLNFIPHVVAIVDESGFGSFTMTWIGDYVSGYCECVEWHSGAGGVSLAESPQYFPFMSGPSFDVGKAFNYVGDGNLAGHNYILIAEG